MVAETICMRLRMFPRAGRMQYRIGNVLADISGEIVRQPQLADGTGAHAIIEQEISAERTARYAGVPVRPS